MGYLSREMAGGALYEWVGIFFVFTLVAGIILAGVMFWAGEKKKVREYNNNRISRYNKIMDDSRAETASITVPANIDLKFLHLDPKQ